MKYIKLCSIILLSIILSIAGTFYIPSALNQVCAINKNKALNSILPATAPVIKAGVMMANIIWNIAKPKSGIVEAYFPTLPVRPTNPKWLKSPIIPKWSVPKASE